MELRDLERAAGILALEDPRTAPAGPMARFAGDQVLAEEIATTYADRIDGLLGPLPDAVLQSVRVFPIPPLQGVSVSVAPSAFCAQLVTVFDRIIPGVTENIPDARVRYGAKGSEGLIEKYHLLDGVYPGPPDDGTGQEMVIELGGSVAGPDGPLKRGEPFPEVIKVTITDAHWGNVSGLRIGVGFYL